MKYNVGDKVRINSFDWFRNEGINIFNTFMMKHYGEIVTIKSAYNGFYRIKEDGGQYCWNDEMIECKVEEENSDCKKCGLTRNSTRCLFMDNCQHNKQKNIIEIPEGWVAKDENGNIINATKIVLEKKKKEYPKTYEECRQINDDGDKIPLKIIGIFTQLINARNAYWKIAGEEMGLGKPWEPSKDKMVYSFYRHSNEIETSIFSGESVTFEFPTAEMRDAFYENFKNEIEICKELL